MFQVHDLLDSTDKLLSASMNQMGEAQKYRKDYAPYVLTLVNGVLADCFHFNNTMREDKGLPPLPSIPAMREGDTEIPYEYETLRRVMVYRLAYWLLFQDEEYSKANAMMAEYEQNMARSSKARYADMGGV